MVERVYKNMIHPRKEKSKMGEGLALLAFSRGSGPRAARSRAPIQLAFRCAKNLLRKFGVHRRKCMKQQRMSVGHPLLFGTPSRARSCSSATGLLASVTRRRLVRPPGGRHIQWPTGLWTPRSEKPSADPACVPLRQEFASQIRGSSQKMHETKEDVRWTSSFVWYTFRGSNPGHPD